MWHFFFEAKQNGCLPWSVSSDLNSLGKCQSDFSMSEPGATPENISCLTDKMALQHRNSIVSKESNSSYYFSDKSLLLSPGSNGGGGESTPQLSFHTSPLSSRVVLAQEKAPRTYGRTTLSEQSIIHARDSMNTYSDCDEDPRIRPLDLAILPPFFQVPVCVVILFAILFLRSRVASRVSKSWLYMKPLPHRQTQ